VLPAVVVVVVVVVVINSTTFNATVMKINLSKEVIDKNNITEMPFPLQEVSILRRILHHLVTG